MTDADPVVSENDSQSVVQELLAVAKTLNGDHDGWLRDALDSIKEECSPQRWSGRVDISSGFEKMRRQSHRTMEYGYPFWWDVGMFPSGPLPFTDSDGVRWVWAFEPMNGHYEPENT